MANYKLNDGRVMSVSEEEKEKFLKEAKDKNLNPEKIKEEKSGNQVDSAESADEGSNSSTETTQSQDNQADDTESVSENGSSESQDNQVTYNLANKNGEVETFSSDEFAKRVNNPNFINRLKKNEDDPEKWDISMVGPDGEEIDLSVPENALKYTNDDWKEMNEKIRTQNEYFDENNMFVDYKISKEDNKTRKYFNEETQDHRDEVSYPYDRSDGIRFQGKSKGQFVDGIANGFFKPLADYIAKQWDITGDQSHTEEISDVMRMGGDEQMTTDQANDFWQAIVTSQSKETSESVQSWTKKMEEYKNPVLGFIMATAENPSAASDVVLQSMFGQYRSAVASYEDGGENLKLAIGAGTIEGLRQAKKLPGWGKFVGLVGGFFRGNMAAWGGIMEGTGKMGELIVDHFAEKGISFENVNEEMIIDLYNNKEEWNKITNKSIVKGASISLIENAMGSYSTQRTFNVISKGSGILNTLNAGFQGLLIDAVVGGGGGEVVSDLLIGEKPEKAPVMLEMLGGIGSGSVNVTTGVLAGLAAPTKITVKNPNARTTFNVLEGKGMEINMNDNISFPELQTILETATAEELVQMEIDVKNNPGLQNTVNDAQNKAIVQLGIDSYVTGINDRKKLAELKIELNKVEEKAKLFSNSSIIDQKLIQNKIDNINKQIEEIYSKYIKIDDSGGIKFGVDPEREAKIKETASNILNILNLKAFDRNLTFVKKHASKYGMQVLDNMTQEEINRYIKNNNINLGKGITVGFVDYKNGNIVINKQIAMQYDMTNVGNHELLHVILKGYFKGLDVNVMLDQLKGIFGEKQWNIIEAAVYAKDKDGKRIYTDKYLQENPDEWLTQISELAENESISYNNPLGTKLKDYFTSIFGTQVFGYDLKKTEGQKAYDLLRSYSQSIKDNELKMSIYNATKGDKSGGEGVATSKAVDIDKSKSALDDNLSLLPEYTSDEQSLEDFKKQKRGSSIRDQVFIEIMMNNVLDGLIYNKIIKNKKLGFIAGNEEAIQRTIQEVKDRLIIKMDAQYRPYINNDGQLRSIFSWAYGDKSGFGGAINNVILDIQKAYIQDKVNTGPSLDNTTADGTTFDAEDTSQSTDIDDVDILAENISEQKGEVVSTDGKIVKDEFGLSDEVNEMVSGTIEETNYDTEGNYEDVKRDIISQENEKSSTKNQVDPTGPLYPIIEAISNFVFGVDPKAVMAKPQNLTTSESTNARTKIAELMESLGVKEALKLILPNTQFNLKTGKAIGINTGLLKTLYVDGGLRVPNIKGKVLNIDNMTDAQILEAFGINSDFTLMPNDRKYDGPVKGFIIQTSTIVANQNIREGKQSGSIGIGRPEVVFSKVNSSYIKSGFEATPTSLAKEIGYVLTDRTTKKSTGLTPDQIVERNRVTDAFLLMFPQFRSLLRLTVTGRTDGSTYYKGTKEFDNLHPNRFPDVEQIYTPRFLYSKGKRIIPDFFSKIDPEEQAKMLPALYQFAKAVEAYTKKNKKDKFYFIELLRDTGVDQNKLTRILSPVKFVLVNQNKGKLTLNLDEDVTQEHALAQSQTGTGLIKAAFDQNVDGVWKAIEKTYTQGALSNKDNAKVGAAGFTSDMPAVYWKIVQRILDGKLTIHEGMAFVVRYTESGVDLNNYMLVDNKTTIPEYFGLGIENIEKLSKNRRADLVKIQNDLILLQLTGEMTESDAVGIFEELKKLNKISMASKDLKNLINERKAISNRVVTSKTGESVGASVFDFDETIIQDGKNFVLATNPGTGETIKISSSEYPVLGPKYAELGYKFNFDDFAKVKGGKPGPFFKDMKKKVKKYGPENVFILTARPPSANIAIHAWLKSKGIDIPIENITGLGDGTGDAKAQFMIDKFAEGYNDVLFVDDAKTNTDAVRDALNQLPLKSKVIQAVIDQYDIKSEIVKNKIKFSKTASKDFNDMLERTIGVGAHKVFSQAEARRRGKNKGKWEFFVPPSAEDFKGLIYRFLGTGKQGDKDALWFKNNLFKPYSEGIRAWNTYKQNMADEYSSLKKNFPNAVKILNEKAGGTKFTNDTAIRVYLWKKAGFDIPGISKTAQTKLLNHIKKNPELMAFAEGISKITRTEKGYIKPNDYWTAETIASDLNNVVNKVGRKQFLEEWSANKDAVFSPENLNKIEATYGTPTREALENMLYRMETGRNRTSSQDKNVSGLLNWINGSVGAVMFLNMRSSLLQTISMVNFINFGDNNMFKAAAAFANQPQYWKDFVTIFNSDMLKQRRAGLQIDVSASELSKAFAESGNKPQAIIAYLLEKGFTPTRIADSFAIAAGGSTFYRNRINTYVSRGMSKAEAESQAFLDFQEVAEETQQSSRPDMISQQQAGTLGRIILAWQNTPMQMTRLTKKAYSDIINNRGDMKANISQVLYYGIAQNILFGTLQSGLAFLMFGSDMEDEKIKDKQLRVINGTLDSFLRGTGIYGAGFSTLKNTLLQWEAQRKKGYGQQDWAKVNLELLSLSPPIGSKFRKINSAIKTYEYNKGVPQKLKYRIENPMLAVYANIIEAGTNIPLARAINKANNIEEALTGNHELWQRVALFAGWNRWDLGILDEELEDARQSVRDDKQKQKEIDKIKKKEDAKREKERLKKLEEERKKKEGIKNIQCSGVKSNGKRCGIMIETKAKTALCVHHKEFKDGMDRDSDGIKEYRCTGIKGDGKRCNNKTENKNKKCYAHQ